MNGCNLINPTFPLLMFPFLSELRNLNLFSIVQTRTRTTVVLIHFDIKYKNYIQQIGLIEHAIWLPLIVCGNERQVIEERNKSSAIISAFEDVMLSLVLLME